MSLLLEGKSLGTYRQKIAWAETNSCHHGEKGRRLQFDSVHLYSDPDRVANWLI